MTLGENDCQYVVSQYVVIHFHYPKPRDLVRKITDNIAVIFSLNENMAVKGLEKEKENMAVKGHKKEKENMAVKGHKKEKENMAVKGHEKDSQCIVSQRK